MISIKRHLLLDGPIGLYSGTGKSGILKKDYPAEWKELHRKPYTFFTEEFKSDWEMKTGILWQEWGK